ncbi:hypothetical protein [Vulcanisaeta distributa]|nr:hypothetical protein [Vulcanisaeta distributa]
MPKLDNGVGRIINGLLLMSNVLPKYYYWLNEVEPISVFCANHSSQ